MAIELFEHQKLAIDALKTGSILCGGVGSGKSRTSIGYYFLKECDGKIKINGQGGYSPMKRPKNLYIITTAKKRDTLDWEREGLSFLLSTNPELNTGKIIFKVDSWNNINKYRDVKDSFFIFDEQRLVGSGAWVKSFYKISKKNNWILLTATPGDTWMDYIPVFVANGFYKNRTEFIRRHVIYSPFTKFPKIDKYIDCGRLIKLKKQILVRMKYKKKTISNDISVTVPFDKEKFNTVMIKRWNPFDNKPIRNISELCYLMRKVVNSDQGRLDATKELILKTPKIIIFYNFDYELELLRKLSDELKIPTSEWNGHKHQEIPKSDTWIYLVQYTAGAEGWECIDTDSILFYSQNYSYKIMIQSAGRIDRMNTNYSNLYYYHLKSYSVIDLAIAKALKQKRNFNEYKFTDI